MFRTLYLRLMVIFVTVLMIAMAFLSLLLYQRIRADKIDARLSELTMQAQDVAFLTRELFVAPNVNAQRLLFWKANAIMRDFDANLLIVDNNGQLMPIGDDQVEIVAEFTTDETLPLLQRVLAGQGVSQRATDTASGNTVFTVGVPIGSADRVLGGVFIHSSVQNVEASYRDIVNDVIRAMLISFVIGSVMILLVCQLIARPLREMARAADRFARGKFENRIPVRTRDEIGRLAEALNSMAQDLARLEAVRREFVANVSHELRSPLTSMQGFLAGILDGTVQDADRDQYLNVVLDETRRLSKLISTLLDLSMIESGQTPLSKVYFDAGELAARVLARQEPAISAKGIDVSFVTERETFPVFADRDRIEQVLVNLIDNAIKFAEGAISVTVRGERGQVQVTVRDDGPGIAAEDLPHVLERFYTADKARTTGTGSGLGLSIARSIIEQHGGRLDVFSEPGAGTAFSFRLEAS
ncbi:MAG: cell wall metabolism sensor histidine kinase WalK [Clostridia bacterium]|nr:cell wall metabolism sensor histidine kinase WalK [Clostridia bacterium]